MRIDPDTKDWTWVLERPCPECGFEASRLDRATLPSRIAGTSEAWAQVLRRPDAHRRPDDRTWSPLEYACHVRDVHCVYAGRIGRMLEEDDPLYDNWDQDATAIEARYGEQDPGTVAAELTVAAQQVGTLYEGLTDAQWERPGRRSDGASFSVESIGRYYLHDIEHHIWDVTGSLPHAGG